MKKISDKLINGLNKQITAEFASAYLYLAMADHLHAQSFNGMAQWFRVQAEEEKGHGLKINNFLLERNITPDLEEIPGAKGEWKDIAALFEEAYNHECTVSEMIYDLVAQAMEDKDWASLSFLQWFVDEQVEEESQSLELLEKARMIDGKPAGLLTLDAQMGARKE